MISVDEEKENTIRHYAQEISGGKKGSLSEFIWITVSHYIEEFKQKHEKEASFKRMIERMKHAKKLGILNREGKAYSSRDELYER